LKIYSQSLGAEEFEKLATL